MSLLPNHALFWEGPIHGELRWINQYIHLVPVHQEFTALAPPSLMAPSLEVVRYNAQVFTWVWKGERREGIVMVLRHNAATEIEAVMKFLENLWRNSDTERQEASYLSRMRIGHDLVQRIQPGIR